MLRISTLLSAALLCVSQAGAGEVFRIESRSIEQVFDEADRPFAREFLQGTERRGGLMPGKLSVEFVIRKDGLPDTFDPTADRVLLTGPTGASADLTEAGVNMEYLRKSATARISHIALAGAVTCRFVVVLEVPPAKRRIYPMFSHVDERIAVLQLIGRAPQLCLEPATPEHLISDAEAVGLKLETLLQLSEFDYLTGGKRQSVLRWAMVGAAGAEFGAKWNEMINTQRVAGEPQRPTPASLVFANAYLKAETGAELDLPDIQALEAGLAEDWKEFVASRESGEQDSDAPVSPPQSGFDEDINAFTMFMQRRALDETLTGDMRARAALSVVALADLAHIRSLETRSPYSLVSVTAKQGGVEFAFTTALEGNRVYPRKTLHAGHAVLY